MGQFDECEKKMNVPIDTTPSVDVKLTISCHDGSTYHGSFSGKLNEFTTEDYLMVRVHRMKVNNQQWNFPQTGTLSGGLSSG